MGAKVCELSAQSGSSSSDWYCILGPQLTHFSAHCCPHTLSATQIECCNTCSTAAAHRASVRCLISCLKWCKVHHRYRIEVAARASVPGTLMWYVAIQVTHCSVKGQSRVSSWTNYCISGESRLIAVSMMMHGCIRRLNQGVYMVKQGCHQEVAQDHTRQHNQLCAISVHQGAG